MKMKTLMIFLALLINLHINAQQISKNDLSTGLFYAFNEDGYNLNMYNFSYQRSIGFGLSVLIQMNKAHGGKKVSSIFNKNDLDFLSRQPNIFGSGYENNKDVSKTYGEFTKFRNFGLGLKKKVKLSDKIFMSFAVSGIYTKISITKIENINHDKNNKLIFYDLFSTHSNTKKWGILSSLGINYKVNDYVKLGTNIAYMTKPQFFIIGLNSYFSF